MADKKITYISLLQIIGPIFVVLGHSLNGLDCPGPWYVFSKEWIYIFHMPLFFLISGYLLSYRGYLNGKTYGQFVLGKFKRLLIPYLVWNALFWVPKFFVQSYIADDASLNIADALKAFVFPRLNVWGHTWFLMGLFIVYLAAPLFEKLFKSKKLFVCTASVVVCIVLYVLPISTKLLALNDLHRDLLFFVIGCLLGQMKQKDFICELKRYRLGFIVGAIVFSAVALIWREQTTVLHFIPCLFILMSFLSVFVSVETLPAFLEQLASYSFGIYIMHWPVMIVVRIILHQILDLNVTVTAIMMSVLGYAVPILVILLLRALPFEKVKKPLKYLLGV